MNLRQHRRGRLALMGKRELYEMCDETGLAYVLEDMRQFFPALRMDNRADRRARRWARLRHQFVPRSRALERMYAKPTKREIRRRLATAKRLGHSPAQHLQFFGRMPGKATVLRALRGGADEAGLYPYQRAMVDSMRRGTGIVRIVIRKDLPYIGPSGAEYL